MHLLITCLYWIAVMGALGVGSWNSLAAFVQRDHKTLTSILDVFDAGTAEMDGASVVGFFQGRPARVSTRHGLNDYIRVCVSGHFFLLLEVRTKRARKIGAVRNGLVRLSGLWFLLYILLGFHLIAPDILVWKVLAAAILSYFTVFLLGSGYGKLTGHFESPKQSRWEASLPGSSPLQYMTYSPSRSRCVIDRPEIQDSLRN